MEITINDILKQLPDQPQTLQQLMDQEIPGPQKGIAVAVNNSVVPKTDWNKKIISDKDSILIIKATQGG